MVQLSAAGASTFSEVFWPTLWATVVGTFIGAGLAIGTTLALRWGDNRRRERRAVQAVIEQMHRSRALVAGQERRNSGALSPQEREDRDRCVLSVLHVRDRVAHVRDEVALTQQVVDVLDGMFVACQNYLNSTERSPTAYVEALMTLRGELEEGVNRLAACCKGVSVKSPGAAITDRSR